MHVCFCYARCSFFLHLVKRFAGKNVSGMTYFVLGEGKTLTQVCVSADSYGSIGSTGWIRNLIIGQ